MEKPQQMTMHLAHPSLSLTGKKRGKKKYASAAHAALARDLDQQWQANQKKWAEMSPQFGQGRGKIKTNKMMSPLVSDSAVQDPARDLRQHPSLDTGHGNACKAPAKVYTGDKILGIAIMHKSNMVPVFSNQEAVEISTMRRG